jgi:ion channel-forming bestrophin family protein
MLVFRNQTSWNRFWDGRNNLTTITTCVRNLARVFLTCSYLRDQHLDASERADIDQTIRILVAIPFAVKNHLRAEWGAAFAPDASGDVEEGGNYNITPRLNPEYENLLPAGIKGHEDHGLGLPLQLTFMIEAFITRGFDRGWFSPPAASQLTSQINTLVAAYGKMETIRITPMPIAHLIHQKQVLALFCCVLPFAMVDEMGWWTILIVTLVTFTLYGIEGIGCQLEDPFGHDRNDIKMDAIVADTKVEVFVLLDEWKRTVYRGEQNNVKGELFYDAILPNGNGTHGTA